MHAGDGKYQSVTGDTDQWKECIDPLKTEAILKKQSCAL